MDLYTKSGEAELRAGELRSPCNPIRKESRDMRTRDNLIKVHLTEDESERLKSYAVACGITQSALIRTLIQGRIPKPLPPEPFWAMLNELYIIHSGLQCIDKQQELEAFILRLQTAVTLPERV
ncbi:MAG: hypothetical protein FWE19_03255 [Oscillospiraceae bacterium]|nr:hypothetical protein [Oscillospiraceae bacterium]